MFQRYNMDLDSIETCRTPEPDRLLSDARSGVRSFDVCRHRSRVLEACQDSVAEECPVALVFNGISHAVMMATPRDLELFAIGFALSEGIIEHRKQIFDLEVCLHEASAEVQITIGQAAFAALKQHRRSLAGRTGCGVCGIDSLALLDLTPESVAPAPLLGDVGTVEISRIIEQLPHHQPLMQATGCTHAAAWCDPHGAIVRVFEDVGRHNALDKLFGWLSEQQLAPNSGLVFLSSRASYELVRKAARRNVALLATVSAPTSLAIDIARAAGIRLLSFCRPGGFVEY